MAGESELQTFCYDPRELVFEYFAYLLVLNSSPLEKIGNTHEIFAVFLNGQTVDRVSLYERGELKTPVLNL